MYGAASRSVGVVDIRRERPKKNEKKLHKPKKIKNKDCGTRSLPEHAKKTKKNNRKASLGSDTTAVEKFRVRQCLSLSHSYKVAGEVKSYE